MNSTMHIGIVGPIATIDIAHLIDLDVNGLPRGYAGAPLLATLIGELLQRGHRVSAFTLSNDLPLNTSSLTTVQGDNFSISFCPMRPRAWRPNGWLPGRIVDLYRFERQALQKAIAQVAPDVVHAHWAYEFALAALATGIPHVVTCHDSPYVIARLASRSRPTRSAYRWLRVVMARKVLREAQCITAVSPYMRDEVQALARAQIVIVPNPVDDLAFSLNRARQAPVVPRLAMVCNGWGVRKNPEPALMAFDQLRRQEPAAELHLYGHDFGPGETAELWCAARGIQDGMVFHGAIAHQPLIESLANCDLLLHSSLEESFGMVIAESMAMGIPVVAGESSGAVPWVVGQHGVLCDVHGPATITRALRQALEPDRYAKLSREGSTAAQARFSTANVVDQFYLLYTQALEDPASRAARMVSPRNAV